MINSDHRSARNVLAGASLWTKEKLPFYVSMSGTFPTTAAAIEYGKLLAQRLRGDPRIDDPNLYIRVIDESGAEVHRASLQREALVPGLGVIRGLTFLA
jgi:hypothetical protein